MNQHSAGKAYSLRAIAGSDLDAIVRHRHRMFVDAGRPDDAGLRAKSDAFREWLQPRLADGRYYGWMIEHESEVVAGLGMMTVDWPPHPLHLEPARGYILNVYTEPSHRRQGLAKRLTERALAEAAERQLHVLFLHATEHGRLVYDQAGFRSTNEMQLHR